MPVQFDYLMIGGGLQSSLLALAIEARQSGAKVGIVERGSRLGGDHTWCFHAGDIEPKALEWLTPLVAHRWPGYRVRFPGLERKIDREYSAITSSRLHDVLQKKLTQNPGWELFLNAKAMRIAEHSVKLADGRKLAARVVIDARGHTSSERGAAEGFQKFVGLEMELEDHHHMTEPLLMDATVDQRDGYRFIYVLPLAPRTLLVEDTYFSRDPTLERETLRVRVLDHVEQMSLKVFRILREEEGVLSMPWKAKHPMPMKGPLVAGFRGGFFHPATGYSLPVAARLAEFVAQRAPEALYGPDLCHFVRQHRRQASFCHLLNHMLFRWFRPEDRWHVFERFYQLPLETIERFYALKLERVDQGRLVLGRPPRGMSLRYRFAEGAQR